MFKKDNFFRDISLVKIALGLITILLTYNFIHINEDPIIAIGLAFTGLFILLWGVSFFIFYGVLYLINDEESEKIRLQKDSYKSSLLFGMYVIINILLIILTQRTKALGVILLIVFVLLHIVLFKITPNDN